MILLCVILFICTYMDINFVIDWIVEYYLVLISGIAVPPVWYLVNKFSLKKDDTYQIKQTQKSGKKSTNIQSGKNIEINRKDV